MEKYDYDEAVKADIREWLEEHEEGHISERRRDKIYDDLFVSDSVTGNASGSYTCNTWQAEENLCHNTDLIEECMEEFCIEPSREFRGAEYWDVSIRCMILGRVLDEIIEEWNEKHAENNEENENENEEE